MALPKKNTTHTLYLSLVSQADTTVFQTNPTLATGDVKVSTDGGAEANIATLPVVTPAGSKRVKVVLSTSEMNGDNCSITFSDAAGAEWADLTYDIPIPVANVDDIKTETALVVADTNELQTDWKDGGRLDLLVDGIKAKTDLHPTAAQWTKINDHHADVLKIVFSSGSTTTGVISTVDGNAPSFNTDEDLKGRILVFRNVSPTTLKHVATDITAFDQGTNTVTFTAIPVSVTTHTAGLY